MTFEPTSYYTSVLGLTIIKKMYKPEYFGIKENKYHRSTKSFQSIFIFLYIYIYIIVFINKSISRHLYFFLKLEITISLDKKKQVTISLYI